LRQLHDELMFHEFILFINHERKEIELLIDDGRVTNFSYSDLELIKDFFTKVGGIILESDLFKNLELFSYEEDEVIKEAIKKMEKRNFINRFISIFKNYLRREKNSS